MLSLGRVLALTSILRLVVVVVVESFIFDLFPHDFNFLFAHPNAICVKEGTMMLMYYGSLAILLWKCGAHLLKEAKWAPY